MHLAYAVVFAVVLMIGEAYRSWGAGRPVVSWLDDMIAGTVILAGVLLIGRGSAAGWNVLAGGWGAIWGLAYGSFFSKFLTTNPTDDGNIPFQSLLWIIGFGLIAATVGLFWCWWVSCGASTHRRNPEK
ncbi:MAG TPA: hypothetical protein VIY86_00725 [Pirellulaceae bacterium]